MTKENISQNVSTVSIYIGLVSFMLWLISVTSFIWLFAIPVALIFATVHFYKKYKKDPELESSNFLKVISAWIGYFLLLGLNFVVSPINSLFLFIAIASFIVFAISDAFERKKI